MKNHTIYIAKLISESILFYLLAFIKNPIIFMSFLTYYTLIISVMTLKFISS